MHVQSPQVVTGTPLEEGPLALHLLRDDRQDQFQLLDPQPLKEENHVDKLAHLLAVGLETL